jgi:hypothetical protein
MSGELITADGQLQYKTYLLGDNERTFMVNLNGWDDLPPIDSSNTIRPASHGARPGKKLAGQRIITWTGRFASEKENWIDDIAELKSVFGVAVAEEEYEIVVRSRTDTKLVYGTVSARTIPLDYSYSYYGASLTLQFECSDPRKYSLANTSIFISMPSDTDDGLDYPLVYPLDYGVDTISSNANVINSGDAPAPATISFRGYCVNPTIINSTTNETLSFNITLSATDELTIDTRDGTVLLNGTADRLYTRTVDSSPIMGFELQSGDNEITIYSDTWDTISGATIVYRNAYF